MKIILQTLITKKNSDLWQFMPDSFIRACKKYEINNAVPILKKFVKEKLLSIHDRLLALETVEWIKPDAEYLKATFFATLFLM